MTPKDFAVAVIRTMGFPETDNNIDALVAWQGAEGGHFANSAYFNPLNTSQKMPGSTFFNYFDAAKTMGVQRYTDWQQGLDATIKTLNNGRYGSIIASFMASAPVLDTLHAIGNTAWGTTTLKNATSPSAWRAYANKIDPIGGAVAVLQEAGDVAMAHPKSTIGLLAGLAIMGVTGYYFYAKSRRG